MPELRRTPARLPARSECVEAPAGLAPEWLRVSGEGERECRNVALCRVNGNGAISARKAVEVSCGLFGAGPLVADSTTHTLLVRRRRRASSFHAQHPPWPHLHQLLQLMRVSGMRESCACGRGRGLGVQPYRQGEARPAGEGGQRGSRVLLRCADLVI